MNDILMYIFKRERERRESEIESRLDCYNNFVMV